jgi:hypothetical protein
MNPKTRRAALYTIAAIAIVASANALAHSYAGLYDWAAHHRLAGWQAMSWPAEIDVFLAVGELALYIAYLDGWSARQRAWPWATALTGLAVSVAGNVGHIQAWPGHPVGLANRLTAAVSPLSAFAGLSVGLLVVKMTRQRAVAQPRHRDLPAALSKAAPSPAAAGGAGLPEDVSERASPALTLAFSVMHVSFFITHPPGASDSASAVSLVRCATTGTISRTINSGRSPSPSSSAPHALPREPAHPVPAHVKRRQPRERRGCQA